MFSAKMRGETSSWSPEQVQLPSLNFILTWMTENLQTLETQTLHSTGDRLPAGGVPSQEPASEGWGFITLFDHHHWSLLVPPTRVALDVLFGCKYGVVVILDPSLLRGRRPEEAAEWRNQNSPHLTDSLFSSWFASLPIQTNTCDGGELCSRSAASQRQCVCV